MANKAISELPQAQNVNNQDLFVLEQSGIAKKLTAETFITEQGIIDALAEALDGHGGIQSVTLSSVSGRIRTYLITFTDGSATTFQVLDGTSIDRIEKTSTAGLNDVYTVFLSDGTTSFFTVTNGLSIASIQKTSTSGLVDTYTITLTDGSTQSFIVTNGERGPVGPAGDYAGIIGRDSLTEPARDDELLIYDVSDELEKKMTVAGLETGLTGKATVRALGSGYNIDNVKAPGIYYVQANATLFDSSPYGIILVQANSGATFVVQTFFAARPGYEGIAQRIYSSSAWGNWYRLGDAHTDSNLAWVENGTTASRAYSVGDYVTINGVLCKITAAVANGGTLTSETNYTVIGGSGGLGKSLNDTAATKRYLGLVSSGSSPKTFDLIGGHFYLIYSFHNTQTTYNGMYYVIAGSSSLTGRVYPIIEATALTITLSQNVMTVSSSLSQAGRLYAVDIGNYNMT